MVIACAIKDYSLDDGKLNDMWECERDLFLLTESRKSPIHTFDANTNYVHGELEREKNSEKTTNMCNL